MDISDLLKAIVLDVRSRDHESILREMSARLLGPREPGSKVICDLRGHESMEGALKGTGAAVFHCLSEDVGETAVALAVSRWDIPHPVLKRPLRIFFLIVSPIKESGTHLQLLSKLEGLLLDRAFQHAILNAGTEAEARRVVRRFEGKGRSLYVPLSREEVFAELETTDKGLSGAEAIHRLGLAGPNTLKRIERSTLLKDFLYNMFLNLFAVLLWAGGGMAFLAGMPELGWAIFSVIIINATFSFWQEYKAESAVEALKKLLPKQVTAVRDGQEREIDASLLVPGDLLRLSEGDSIPADGRLIEAQEMRVDNSALTGESRPIYKISEPVADGKGFIWTEVPNMVFAGTMVLSGDGTIVVTATGMDTEIGKVAYLTQAIRPEMSPLQKEISIITRTITGIAVALGAAFLLIGYLVAGLTFAESFIFAIGIIVANVPEGLLPTVSLSLAMGVQRMAGKNAIVKKLSAVETLGSATVICTDKTGTLTTNQMCVGRLFVNGKLFDVTGTGYSPDGSILDNGEALGKAALRSEGAEALLAALALCNNASLHPPSGKSPFWTISGDPTEGALLTAAGKAGLRTDSLREDFPRIAHLPFERIRKRMTTVHEAREGASLLGLKGKTVAFVKGSPRETLELCTGILSGGKTVPLTDEMRSLVLERNDEMASRGLRILAAAFRPVPGQKGYSADETERDLVFLGLVAMIDPPRPEVRKAVEECGSAGIRVVMVTGDYGLTARAIAAEVGLKASRVITGEELSGMSFSELKETLKNEDVLFARVAPRDKLTVVTALQDNGETVAVTGDGVNDAPALKKADIGIAMGLRGSDVAKESAEIVLADDNFASIVDAVREGRAVYANIKKFITYILTHNVAELVPFLAYIIFRIPLPLTVMQILAIDLGSDIFPALGLGVEQPEKEVMRQKPRSRTERLLDFKTIARAYLFLGPLEAALCLGAFFFAYRLRGFGWDTGLPSSGAVYAAATTMSFAGIVASQMGNVFACRTGRESVLPRLLTNRFIILSLVLEAALMLALIYVPRLRQVFGFAPLTLWDWVFLASFPFIMLAADELRKAFVRGRRGPKAEKQP